MLNKLDCENVNGVMLSLSIDVKSEAPKSRNFSITFNSIRRTNRASRYKFFLFLAVLFNIVSIFYVRISLQAIMIILIVLSFLVFFWISHSVQSESLLVIPSVGIQSSVKYVYGREDNFVPWNSVDDVIINEVIKMNRVLYFLTVLIKPGIESESIKLMPIFKIQNSCQLLKLMKRSLHEGIFPSLRFKSLVDMVVYTWLLSWRRLSSYEAVHERQCSVSRALIRHALSSAALNQ